MQNRAGDPAVGSSSRPPGWSDTFSRPSRATQQPASSRGPDRQPVPQQPRRPASGASTAAREREEKLRMRRQELAAERQARATALAEEQARKDEERRRRIEAQRERTTHDARAREEARRRNVETRRKQLEEQHAQKAQAMTERYMTRSMAIDSARSNKPVYAFGSSTPRTLAYLEQIPYTDRVYNVRLRAKAVDDHPTRSNNNTMTQSTMGSLRALSGSPQTDPFALSLRQQQKPQKRATPMSRSSSGAPTNRNKLQVNSARSTTNVMSNSMSADTLSASAATPPKPRPRTTPQRPAGVSSGSTSRTAAQLAANRRKMQQEQKPKPRPTPPARLPSGTTRQRGVSPTALRRRGASSPTEPLTPIDTGSRSEAPSVISGSVDLLSPTAASPSPSPTVPSLPPDDPFAQPPAPPPIITTAASSDESHKTNDTTLHYPPPEESARSQPALVELESSTEEIRDEEDEIIPEEPTSDELGLRTPRGTGQAAKVMTEDEYKEALQRNRQKAREAKARAEGREASKSPTPVAPQPPVADELEAISAAIGRKPSDEPLDVEQTVETVTTDPSNVEVLVENNAETAVYQALETETVAADQPAEALLKVNEPEDDPFSDDFFSAHELDAPKPVEEDEEEVRRKASEEERKKVEEEAERVRKEEERLEKLRLEEAERLDRKKKLEAIMSRVPRKAKDGESPRDGPSSPLATSTPNSANASMHDLNASANLEQSATTLLPGQLPEAATLSTNSLADELAAASSPQPAPVATPGVTPVVPPPGSSSARRNVQDILNRHRTSPLVRNSEASKSATSLKAGGDAPEEPNRTMSDALLAAPHESVSNSQQADVISVGGAYLNHVGEHNTTAEPVSFSLDSKQQQQQQTQQQPVSLLMENFSMSLLDEVQQQQQDAPLQTGVSLMDELSQPQQQTSLFDELSELNNNSIPDPPLAFSTPNHVGENGGSSTLYTTALEQQQLTGGVSFDTETEGLSDASSTPGRKHYNKLTIGLTQLARRQKLQQQQQQSAENTEQEQSSY